MTLTRFTLTSDHGKARVELGTADGVTWGWDVFNGSRHIRSGVADGELPRVLETIGEETVMPSRLARVSLLAIVTAPMRGHAYVPGSELRGGDLLHVGGTNYVLVHSVRRDPATGETAIRVYNGDQPHEDETLRRAPGALCNLARRDAKP